MQFIQDLPLMVQIIDGVALLLAIVLILVSRRRRRAAAVGTVAPVAATPKKADKAEKLPRRKRRKLAAEAAHSMGVAPIAPEAAAAPEQIVVPPVEVAPEPAGETAPEPAADAVAETEVEAAAPPTEPDPSPAPTAVESDDPYLSAGDEDHYQPEAVVADPGWPTPGELASGFDPDAFDPLPELVEAESDDHSEPTVEVVGDDLDEVEMPTGVIEMPLQAHDGADDWDDDFDPATGWADPTGADAVDDHAWTPDMAQAADDAAVEIEIPVEADGSPLELDEFWGAPDEEWSDPDEIQIVVDEAEELPVGVAHDDPIDAPLDEVDASEADLGAVTAEASEDAPWGEESSVWPAAADDIAPSPVASPDGVQAAGLDGWVVPMGHAGPLVLDLAGVAASGQTLELVIEPTADGRGMRLRIGSGVVISPVAAQALPVEADAPGEAMPMPVDVPLDMGDGEPERPDALGASTNGPAADGYGDAAASVPPIEEAAYPVPAPEAHADMYRHGDDGRDAGAGQTDLQAPIDPIADDDPARILADIRMRLAELDARRQ